MNYVFISGERRKLKAYDFIGKAGGDYLVKFIDWDPDKDLFTIILNSDS